jgi:hypothetical protein
MVILLVCGATTTVLRNKDSPYLGALLNPRNMNNPEYIKGMRWAADNDCFNGFNQEIFIRMLEKIKDLPNCLFVTAPDVVGSAKETLRLFSQWEPVIRQHNLPVALVAQDGQEKLPVPWNKIDALFIGGTTKFKLGMAAYYLVQEAKKRNKWVHMGRVNSNYRIQYAQAIGCDSVDGSGYSKFPDTKIPGALRRLEIEQPMLKELLA